MILRTFRQCLIPYIRERLLVGGSTVKGVGWARIDQLESGE